MKRNIRREVRCHFKRKRHLLFCVLIIVIVHAFIVTYNFKLIWHTLYAFWDSSDGDKRINDGELMRLSVEHEQSVGKYSSRSALLFAIERLSIMANLSASNAVSFRTKLKTLLDDRQNELTNFLSKEVPRVSSPSIQTRVPMPPVKIVLEIIRNMMRHAWTNYVRYAWGANEFNAALRLPHAVPLLGTLPMGVTIVDSLDSLYLMNLTKEFEAAREFVRKLNPEADTEVNLFEYNIRMVGGLLSIYAITKDKMFLEKAVRFADAFMPAFNTTTGLPYSLVNLRTGKAHNRMENCTTVAEIGTLQLEFAYLSELTGNNLYKKKGLAIVNYLRDVRKHSRHYKNAIQPDTGRWCGALFGFGGGGDSFYEYLFKEWLRSGNTQARNMYLEALDDVEKKLLRKSPHSPLLYLGQEWDSSRDGQSTPDMSMEHLACFAGGLFAYSARVIDRTPASHKGNEEAWRQKWFSIGEEITRTCRESYIRTPTGLGPDSFSFYNRDHEATSRNNGASHYILRPEVVESYFYLWRLTKQPIYREWSWDVIQALNIHCRLDSGFSGLLDVNRPQPRHDGIQQSFFLAETLKYLYLTFSDDSLFSLDRWVFNTEAHPFPIVRNHL